MLERLAVALFLCAAAFDLAWLALVPLDWWAVPAVLFGWYLADAASGITHFYLDYRPCTPGVGLRELFFYEGDRGAEPYLTQRRETMARIRPFERVIFDFKTHHPRPNALGRRSFYVVVRSTLLFAALPASLALAAVCLTTPIPGWALAGADSLLVGGTLAQYIHATLHRAKNPWPIRPLRAIGAIMTPEAHGVHHATLDRDFCTLVGWANPAVNALFRLCCRRSWLTSAGLEPA